MQSKRKKFEKADLDLASDAEARRINYERYEQYRQPRPTQNDAMERGSEDHNSVREMDFYNGAHELMGPSANDSVVYFDLLEQYRKGVSDEAKRNEMEKRFQKIFCYGGLFPNDMLGRDEYNKRSLEIKNGAKRCPCCGQDSDEEEIQDPVYLVMPPDSNPPTQ